MRALFRRLDERVRRLRAQRAVAELAQGLVEYALILSLVVLVVIAILAVLGPQIGNTFSRITNGLP